MNREVGAHRRPDLVAVGHQHAGHGLEVGLALGRIRVRVGQEGLALHGVQPVQFRYRRAVIDTRGGGRGEEGGHRISLERRARARG